MLKQESNLEKKGEYKDKTTKDCPGGYYPPYPSLLFLLNIFWIFIFCDMSVIYISFFISCLALFDISNLPEGL